MAAIIVSYRTPRLTLTAVQSALNAGVDSVHVVDNASGDDTVKLLVGLADPRVAITVSPSNKGFAFGANRGAEGSVSDVLVFLNSDAEITRASVEALMEELDRFGARAIVGPRLISPGGVVQRSAGLVPRPGDLLLRGLGVHQLARLMSRKRQLASWIQRTGVAREYETARSAADPVTTTMVSGACFAIGREAFWEIGGFDERYFMYFEDADLCMRATKAGMPIRYVPSAVVTHIGGASSDGDYHDSPAYALSMRQYLEKWWGFRGAALALTLLWIRLAAYALILHPGTRQAYSALRAGSRGGATP